MVKAQKAKRTVRDHEVTREKAKAILKKAETRPVGTDMVNKPVSNLRIQSAKKPPKRQQMRLHLPKRIFESTKRLDAGSSTSKRTLTIKGMKDSELEVLKSTIGFLAK